MPVARPGRVSYHVGRMRRPALALLAVAWLALPPAGCVGAHPADDLELVARPAEPEPGPPPRFVLLARSEVLGEAGPVELWLPLPSSDRFQTVHSLAVEVGPPGSFALEEAEGDRVLHVAAPRPTPVKVRALIERAGEVEGGPALPATLRELPTGLEPTAWAEAAAARGVPARVAHGLELMADGQTLPRRWPEVFVDGAWSPVDPLTSTVDLPPDRVRLAASPPRATVDGRPAEVRTSYSLERR